MFMGYIYPLKGPLSLKRMWQPYENSINCHIDNVQLYSIFTKRIKNRENSVFSEIFYWQQRRNFISISCSNQKFRIFCPLFRVLIIEIHWHWESESEVMSPVSPSEYCLISCLVTNPYFQVTVNLSELPNWGYQWWQSRGLRWSDLCQ